MTRCFHCNEPLQGSTLTARVDGRAEPVCCHGCLAVAELIADAALTDYYRLRDAPGARPDPAAGVSDRWAALSRPEVSAQFTRSCGPLDSATLAVDGLRCAACGWLVDRALQKLPGMTDVSTNTATGRTRVSWQRDRLSLADVARSIAQLGYVPHPLSDQAAPELQQAERRDALKHLMVAGVGMMQVMMFAVAAYSADLAGEAMDASLLKFFRIVSMLVATPVVFYSAAPILAGAHRNVQTRTIGMDLPIAAAVLLAYCASLWNTLRGGGDVYFDSVTMFIFFVTLGRFVQMTVRHRTTDVTDALARQLPACAHLVDRGAVRDVPLAALECGDVVLVRPGEVLPADGELLDPQASIDESLLTGESMAVHKQAGDRLAAGALNAGNAIRLRVTAVSGNTALSHIVSLLQLAHTQRPRLSKAADEAAARFLQIVLIGAGLTCAAWLLTDPSRAFPATLAVLVVACPCAFAIAMPAAVAAATAQLARHGLLLTRIDALETLARVDRVVFDKTGTLTHGDLVVRRCVLLGPRSEHDCLQIAAALELASEHPLARAFTRFNGGACAENVRTLAGAGLEGTIDGEVYRIGTREFVSALSGTTAAAAGAVLDGTVVSLGDSCGELALIELQDIPRLSARFAVAGLHELGIATEILSGDDRRAVASLAAQCGIGECFDRHSPEQKLAHVQRLQTAGIRVAMVGDGINDAPVLAASDLSIAMGRGAALAHASADMVLIADDLACLPAAIRLARRTLRIARQNLICSAVYNFGSLPLAAFGLIPPWLAALGMSLSSIAVVLNAARLLPRREQRTIVATSAQAVLT
jgi:P-type Cu2+ transporter